MDLWQTIAGLPPWVYFISEFFLQGLNCKGTNEENSATYCSRSKMKIITGKFETPTCWIFLISSFPISTYVPLINSTIPFKQADPSGSQKVWTAFLSTKSGFSAFFNDCWKNSEGSNGATNRCKLWKLREMSDKGHFASAKGFSETRMDRRMEVQKKTFRTSL